jgi:hypothetical protein
MNEQEHEAQARIDHLPYRGYKVADLRRVWQEIAPKPDWKAEISVVVPGEQVGAVVAAIRFFTATDPEVSFDPRKPGPVHFLIESEGYRKGPAGDH